MSSTTNRTWVAVTAAAGVCVGVGYVASPLTIWFGIAMAVVLWWAGRGLDAAERRLVWGMLAAAIVLRVVLIVVLFATTDHQQIVSFFWDGDGIFIKRRAQAALVLL